MNDAVPFLDLTSLHRDMEEDFVEIFREALRTGRFIGGSMVEDFEREFAAFCGTRHCAGVGSGTDALRFALIASGVLPGDVAITVPNTFIATTEAVSQAGAMPDFVDVDERTYTMDAEKLREYLETHCFVDAETGLCMHRQSGRRVSVVIPVHLYGQTADMDPILELAGQYRLIVIEDACQAHGAQYFSGRENRWRKAGSMGLAAAFSFYPGKNLGAFGEAGAVTTDNEQIARMLRMLRDHGQVEKYYHEIEGYNGRLDAIQAGILHLKLRRLAEWNERRRQLAHRYSQLLASFDGINLPLEPNWVRSVYHLYVIRTKNRDKLQKFLASRNVGTGLHYPVPLHLQKAYATLHRGNGDLRVAERAAREILSLPLYPGMTEEQQIAVAGCIDEFFHTARNDEQSTQGARAEGPENLFRPGSNEPLTSSSKAEQFPR